jgi:uncharacterized protein (DUF488 family)
VIEGAKEHRIALMCAEKEPLECHRTLLVGRALYERGVEVKHILGNGGLETHESAMDRLIKLTGVQREDLFRSRKDLIDEALARQEEKVAYVGEKLASETAGDAP